MMLPLIPEHLQIEGEALFNLPVKQVLKHVFSFNQQTINQINIKIVPWSIICFQRIPVEFI